MPKVKNYYKILGISKDASEDQVKMAFHNEAEKYNDGSAQGAQDLLEAYEVLTNAKRRMQYDRYINGQINTSQLQSNQPTAPLQPTSTPPSMSTSMMERKVEETAVPSRNGTNGTNGTAPKTQQCWEYLTLESSHNYGTTKYYVNSELMTDFRNAVFSDVMNQYGSQGWELVGIGQGELGATYIFKRPMDVPRSSGKKSASA